ncbi:MAG: isochorismatase family protein [Bacteroidales bacterium]|jgi:nicotinamidase-related amidase|nr:isochorismatase family protein [Bacteroidales bacterium]
MSILFLIIDMQNDFCRPTGTLYVPGAEKDVERLSRFIAENKEYISEIILTQDNHQVMDIAHPCFWKNVQGKHPQPFTSVSLQDVTEGKWIPIQSKEEATIYLQKLEEAGEYTHTIWPEHCIWGSEGAAIDPVLMNEIINWAREGKTFDLISKGTNPLTEHFGAFRANIPIDDEPETQFNTRLLQQLESADRIWVAGEAKSHCVANTLKQLLDYPNVLQKTEILEDCMSNVAGCDQLAVPIFDQAKKLGMKFTTTNQIRFKTIKK